MKTIRIDADLLPAQLDFVHADDPCVAYVGGIGSGKTFAGALRLLSMPPGTACMVCAPTYSMLKDAALATFLEVARPLIATFNRADLNMTLVDGKSIMWRSTENEDRLRGPNLGAVWLDESAYMKPNARDIVLGRLRLAPGWLWETTTPRGKNHVYDAYVDRPIPGARLVRARTRDNIHLPERYIAQLESKYTARFAAQELDGEFIDATGALWSWATVDGCRVDRVPDGGRVLIGVDPAVTATSESDETGIIVVRIVDGVAYVVEDASGRHSATEWPRIVVSLWQQHGADLVVAETNQGGDLVEEAIRVASRQADVRGVRVKQVRATRGKHVRAEPVAALYEHGEVRHVGGLVTLEKQMCTWIPGEDRTSPDRVDALVWALTEGVLARRQVRIAKPHIGRERQRAASDLAKGFGKRGGLTF